MWASYSSSKEGEWRKKTVETVPSSPTHRDAEGATPVGLEQTESTKRAGIETDDTKAASVDGVEKEKIEADEVKTAEVRTDEVKTDEVKTDEVKTDEIQTDEVKTDEVKTDEVKTDEVKTGEVKTDEVKTGESQAVDQLSLAKRLEQLRSSVAALEKMLALQTSEKDDASVVEETADRGDRPQRKSTPMLNYMKIEDYEKRDEKLEKLEDGRSSLLQDKHYSIDVVLASGTPIPPRTAADALPREDPVGDVASGPKTHKNAILCAEQIRFIQINSHALCAVLHEVLYSSETSNSEPPNAPIVMLAPFKPLCHHMGKLEERLQSLEQQFAGMGWEQMAGASEYGPIRSEQSSAEVDNRGGAQSQVAGTKSGYSPSLEVDRGAESTLPGSSVDRPSPPNQARVPVSYSDTLGWLQLTEDGQHIIFTGQRQGYIWSFADKLEDIIDVRRTTKTSPVIALKITLDDTNDTVDEFIFTDPENAQAQLETLSDALF
ncbi:hypothetical protein LTR49_021036 [Elasticomyces elasticus]|nr:hypothetical protein LTR49_021036 [Elasticomyces elasticus]